MRITTGRLVRSLTVSKVCSDYSKWEPLVDIYESESKLIIFIELAGVAADSLTMKVDHKNVFIQGKKSCQLSDIVKVHQLEIDYGSFNRCIDLPHEIDVETVKSEYNNGVLVLHMAIISKHRSIPVR